MIVWGIEDEPVRETIRKAFAPQRPSGWGTAWRIVGWMMLVAALGAAIGAWLVMEGFVQAHG